MIGVPIDQFKKFGCPYCGADKATVIATSHITPEQVLKCCACKQKFATGAKELANWFYDRMQVAVDRSDGVERENVTYIQHPRYGDKKWKYEPKDERPECEGEYITAICKGSLGYSLLYTKTYAAAKRLLDNIKIVLGTENPESHIEYNRVKSDTAELYVSPNEFLTEEMARLINKNEGIANMSIFEKSKRTEEIDELIKKNGKIELIKLQIKNDELKPYNVFKDPLHTGDIIFISDSDYKNKKMVLNTFRNHYDMYIYVVDTETMVNETIHLHYAFDRTDVYLTDKYEYWDGREIIAVTTNPSVFIKLRIDPDNKEIIRSGWMKTFYPIEMKDRAIKANGLDGMQTIHIIGH